MTAPLWHGLAVGLVVLIGFASHRASLCTVRAVAEVLQRQPPVLLASFAGAALWTAAVSGLLALVSPFAPPALQVREPVAWALAGGLAFGIGAAVNGGCSLSTLQRLADGDRSMWVTLGGVALGLLGWNVAESAFGAAGNVASVASPWSTMGAAGGAMLALLSAWCVYQLARVRARIPTRAALRALLTAPSYPPWLAAALLGIAGAVLYTVEGAWSYTNYLRSSAAALVGHASGPDLFHGLLLGALLAGMWLSARTRARLAPPPGDWRRWRGRLAGGILMGVGSALVPGGNDTLILGTVPALSATAILAYAALVAGVALGLVLQQALVRGPAIDR